MEPILPVVPAPKLPFVKRMAIFVRDLGACVYCGASYQHGAKLSVDHVVSRKRGGGDEYENLVCACLRCNRDKAHFSLGAYLFELNDRGQSTAGIAERVAEAQARTILWPLVRAAILLHKQNQAFMADDTND
jgi:hypothetical protein